MQVERFRDSPIGTVVPISGFDQRYHEHYDHFAFVPSPLPDEGVALSPGTTEVVVNAALALGRLDQAGRQIPNPSLLRHPTLRREAQSTSALEGTYAPLTEVLEADLDEGPRSPELIEILNYVTAAEHGFAWVAERRRITVGLILDLHRLLIQRTALDGPETGRVRSIQVVIGDRGRVRDARFVPPPPGPALEQNLHDLVNWINRSDSPGRAVVDAALAHYQFESLHPLNDGNGRIGRLLVVLQMLATGILSEPFLTVSPWFEARRREYQDELQNLSETGDFDRWIAFFAEGIRAQADETTIKIRDLLDFQAEARTLARGSGRASVAVDLAEILIERPIVSVSWAVKRFKVSFPSANNAIGKLVEVGLLREMTGRSYGRVFAAQRVLQILER